MDDCIFCKISKKEAPSYQIYEDDNYFAFLDINSLNKGHTLLIPKEHVRWIWDVKDFGDYFEIAKKIAKGLEKVFKPGSIALVVAGLEVPHAHVHLVPRFPDDGHGEYLDSKNIKEIPEEEMKTIADKIRKAID